MNDVFFFQLPLPLLSICLMIVQLYQKLARLIMDDSIWDQECLNSNLRKVETSVHGELQSESFLSPPRVPICLLCVLYSSAAIISFHY